MSAVPPAALWVPAVSPKGLEGAMLSHRLSVSVRRAPTTQQSLPCRLPSGKHSADPAPGGTACWVVRRHPPRVTAAATRVPHKAEERCNSSTHQDSMCVCRCACTGFVGVPSSPRTLLSGSRAWELGAGWSGSRRTEGYGGDCGAHKCGHCSLDQ